MYFFFIYLLLLVPLIDTSSSNGGGHSPTTPTPDPSTNPLGLTFGHRFSKRDNTVIIYFDLSNTTLKEYRYYYYDFRSFGTYTSESEFLPRQRLLDTHNSLRIVGLHEGDYVACLSFIDEYENVFKPRYACYEFTLGEKVVGAHHGGSSGYLAPLLLAFAFVLHVFIAIVHHIKAKNYAHTLLQRFISVTPKSARRHSFIDKSMQEINRELDHPHVSASVQRRLSRVTIDASPETDFLHNSSTNIAEPNDELPLYTLPHHGRTTSMSAMEAIPEYAKSNTLDSVSSMKHLIETTPWTKRQARSVTSSIRRTSPLNVY